MRGAGKLLVLLVTSCGVALASEVEVVQAVDPGWPAADRSLHGRITLDFVLSGRTIVSVAARRSSLPEAFSAEAVASFREWLIESDDGNACGFTRGTVEAVFEGGGDGQATFGPLRIQDRPAVLGLAKLDRVEVSAGRIRRSDLGRIPIREAERAAGERAAYDRWAARWRELGRAEPATFAPEGRTPPKPKVRIEPTYPRGALQNGVEGWVHAVMTVGANGSVYSVEVVGSEPTGTFDQATRAALRRWKLEPARDAAGDAIEMRVCQSIVYRLTTY